MKYIFTSMYKPCNFFLSSHQQGEQTAYQNFERFAHVNIMKLAIFFQMSN